MTEFLVDLDDAVIKALNERAEANSCSSETEIGTILAQATGFVRHDAEGAICRKKRFGDLVGIFPGGRSADKITAEIRALRDEWDD